MPCKSIQGNPQCNGKVRFAFETNRPILARVEDGLEEARILVKGLKMLPKGLLTIGIHEEERS